ncbi:uncharacterized protein HMPREF1541_01836 [Cyphellophora europaea CBS 101466]|uniref:Rhodopsin domain-containing protein n=1 Tax=Cyphellophora europaea (strain CBS 101466) TaxID=1220924 RepID=W2S3Y8_CYPE1|nr:uncharacterized protein HMPREF1541_01836 [Cyphellophora europaea CBS 101466]ETN42679.1 hypothetical protein HMPREF1541_01836 [Cyphellophora europaea CBS 101466]
MAIPVAGRGPEVAGVYALFTTLTTVTMALRVYCRAIFVAHASCAFLGVRHGTGQHAWDIQPPSEIQAGLMWWWMCEFSYVLSNMFIKASIAIMLLRLTIVRTHRLIIIVTIIVTEIYSTVFFFLFVFQCMPSKYFWTQVGGGRGSCMDPSITVNSAYAYSAIICVGDWIFAILPFFIVWNLQMSTRQKLMVALILSMGAIASTATIIRIPYIHTLNNKADFLYATTDVAIWSSSETGLGITAANTATLRPLVRSWLNNTQLASTARSIARRPSFRRGPSSGAGAGAGSRPRPKISAPVPVARASISAGRGCLRSHRRRDDCNLEEGRNDMKIMKTTARVMVENDYDEHDLMSIELDSVHSVSTNGDAESLGSKAHIAVAAPPPPPKDPRSHCRCNCKALDFEQVRSILEGTWIGSMGGGGSGGAGPSGEKSKDKVPQG